MQQIERDCFSVAKRRSIYIYDVSISGFIRSSIYIYDINSLRVKDTGWRFTVVSCVQALANKVSALKEVIISQREGKL